MSSIIATNESHVTFARALASPDKEIRDKTVKSLIHYASSLEDITEMEMLKLWKALYYCMWLSDKAPIQMELALAISGLYRSFKHEDIAVLYFGMFFKTMIREWTLLDQHRINKFYTLVRLMLRVALSSMHSKGWTEGAVDSVLDVLEEEVLMKTPNGLRLHVADIFLQELWTVSKGDMDTDCFVRVLRPFFAAVQGCTDTAFQERVSKKVFSAFVNYFAREHSVQGEEGEGQQLFPRVRTSVLQGLVFSIASDSDTIEKNRRKIYLLHQEFPRVTGQPFALEEDEDEEEEEEEMEVEEVVVASSSSGSKAKAAAAIKEIEEQAEKKKSKKRKVEEEVVAVPVKKVEKKEEKKVAEAIPVAKKEEKIVGKKEEKKVQKKEEKKVEKKEEKKVEKVEEKKEEKKRKAEEEPLPSAVMVAVPSAAGRLIEAAAVAVAAPFIKAERFTGGKLGYVFKKGKTGLGYYQDSAQMKRHAKQIAKNTQAKTPSPPAPVPVVTTVIAEPNSAKKAKKEQKDRRQSGDFPPASSVRVDDLEEEGEEAKVDRRVRFGKPQSIGYTDSIAGLKSGASPHSSLTPSHSALKSLSSSKSPLSSGKKGGSQKKNKAGSKSSSSFLAGRAN